MADSLDSQTKQLLSLLQSDEVATATELATTLCVSERTVRTKLKELEENLKRHGARLVAKRRIGYKLEITDSNVFDAWITSMDTYETASPNTSRGRMRFILTYLLNHDEYIKLESLSERLYISRNTITTDLKRVEEILEKYHLSISRRPNYGIRLEGSEFNRRSCIAKQLHRYDGQADDPSPEGLLLKQVLSSVVKERRFQMAENAFRAMIVQLYVANQRQRDGRRMVYSGEARAELRQSLSSGVLSAAERLAEEMEKHTGIHYDEDETLYLAIHLSGTTAMDDAERIDSNMLLVQRLEELVDDMLTAAFEGNGVDFRDNVELKDALLQHMVPLDTRLRFNISLANPILEHIKTEYSFAFMVATTACTVLQAYYGKKVPQDEVGYIAIIIGLAIEKQHKPARKKNIVVVCVSGRGTSKLFLHRCRQAFGDYIDNIYEKTVFELSELDYAGLGIDFIFTTVPLDMEKLLPVPVYEVSSFLDSREMERYQRIFVQGDGDFLSEYFDARLFLPRLVATTKEDALKQMCDHAGQFKTLGEDFYPLVLKREEMGQTDFGNLVAIPHTYRIVSPDRFVMTAVLDKPIWWGHNPVQVVFLLSLPESTDKTVESFYKTMLNFQSDRELVKRVIEGPTFTGLMQAFREARQK